MRATIVFALFLSLAGSAFSTMAQAPQAPPPPPAKLTIQDAERIALENHPQIRAAQFTAQAVQQTVTEARSAYYPTSVGSATAVEADHNSRIAAGGLNNPVIYNRFSDGLILSQLITDFGRTQNLVATTNFNAKAELQNAAAKRDDIILQVHQAYFATLRAQAIVNVAKETVNTRQILVNQVTALEQSKLKSSLDVSFANVALGEAKLLLSQAQNDLESNFINLSNTLGYATPQTFELNDAPISSEPLPDITELVAEALRNRPDLSARRFKEQAASRFASAERDLKMPTISFLGAAGVTPVRQDKQASLTARYAAAGVNLSIPIFNGHLFSSRYTEAQLRDQAETQNVRDLENRINRDVRIVWGTAKTTYERLGLTAQLLQQASTAFDLAQARYNLGLSSIVELSEAQLHKTSAEIQQASAKYEYQSVLAALDYQIGKIP